MRRSSGRLDVAGTRRDGGPGGRVRQRQDDARSGHPAPRAPRRRTGPLRGRDIADLPDRELRAFRRRAQVIFQDSFSSLSPYMRVGEIVEEPLVIHRLGSERSVGARPPALEQVKLRPAAEFADRYPHTLSGGQRQRVSIARAMILRAELPRGRRAGLHDRRLQPGRDPGAARDLQGRGESPSCTSPTTSPVPATSPTASR